MAHKLKGIRWAMVAFAICAAPTMAIAQNSLWASFWRNRAPVISGTPAGSVVAGNLYSFLPVASDPDGNALTFTIRNRPAWATFSSTTGQLQGTPQVADVNTYSDIVISVRDWRRTTSLAPFGIVVKASPSGNSAPVISGAPPASVQAGSAYAFTPTASDVDNNALIFGISGRPAWATFDTQTGRLAGTPPAGVAGMFGNIAISVSDGTATAALPAFSINVTAPATNTAPTISGTPPSGATVGTQYAFTPTANDANGNTLTFSIANRPVWATFSASTGGLQGSPTASNVGAFGNIVISVSDGQASVSLPAFTITVSAAPNTPPTISGTPATSVLQDTQYAFQPTASDANGDVLAFSIVNRPAWATFTTSTGRLQGTPTAGNVGTTSGIIITVTDGQASRALAAFNIAVQAIATGSATLSWQPPTQNSDGSPLTNLAGYRVYWGSSLGTYPNSVTLNNPGLATYVVSSLVPGTYYFVVTAVNTAGTESQHSNSASKTIL